MPVPAATPASAFFAPGSHVRNRSPDHDCDQTRNLRNGAVKRLWMAVKPVSNGEPCASTATGIGRTEQEQLWLDARAAAEEGVRFGGRNELATNVSFAPPAARQFGCLWRKRNLTQSPCPTTSRHSVIPGRNNRRIGCRDQVDRSVRLDTSCKDFSSEGDWLTKATRIPPHGGRLIWTALRLHCGGGRVFIFSPDWRSKCLPTRQMSVS